MKGGHGRVTIGAVILFAVVLLVGSWLAIPLFLKARADTLVREMCAKDGGIKIYEQAKLPKSRFQGNLILFPNRNGRGAGLPPSRDQRRPEDDYYYFLEQTWLVPEESFRPAVYRLYAKLIRAKDEKVLGEAVTYSRVGGDPIGPWHPSSFGCEQPGDLTDVIRRVFVPGES